MMINRRNLLKLKSIDWRNMLL